MGDCGLALLRLNNDTAIDVLDWSLFSALKRTAPFNAVVKDKMAAWIAECRERVPAGDDYASARFMLQSISETLETRIALRLSNHSFAFWLMLFRSILAVNAPTDRTQRSNLVRDARLIELTIAKYSRYHAFDLRFYEPTWCILPVDDDVERLLEVAALANLAAAFESDIRRLAYGGALISGADGWRVDLPENINQLVLAHTERVAKFGNILRFAGVPGEPGLTPGRGEYWLALAGRCERSLVWSGSEKKMKLGPSGQAGESYVTPTAAYIPIYALLEYTIDAEVRWLRLIDSEIRRRVGFGVDAVLLVIKSCATIGMQAYETYRVGHRLRTLAFTICQRDEIVNGALLEARSAPHLSIRDEEIDRALQFLTHEEARASAITVSTLAGFRHVLEIGEGRVLIDYSVGV